MGNDETPPLEFGEYLGDLMDRRELTPKQLATLLVYEANTIRQWIRGDDLPRLEVLDRIAKALHLDPDSLESKTLNKTYAYSLLGNQMDSLSPALLRQLRLHLWGCWDRFV